MFPNFKSLRDRKNKLKQLAEENSAELQLARIKNDRYKLTQWASDLDQTIDTSTLQQLLRKVASTASQVTPSMVTMGVQATPTMTSAGIQAAPSMSSTGVQSAPSMTSTGMQAVPVIERSSRAFGSRASSLAGRQMTPTDSQYDLADWSEDQSGLSDGQGPFGLRPDIGDEEDSLSDIDDTQSTYDFGTQVEANDFNFQKNARDKIIDQYTINPTIIKRKVNPILNSGTPDKNVYIGTDGKLFNVNNGKLANKALHKYDWVATYDYILNLIDIETKDTAIGSSHQFGFNIESGAYEVLRDILMNNTFPEGTRLPIPYKKGRNPHGGYIPVNGGYRVKLMDGNLKVFDGDRAKSNSQVSWESTLDMYIKFLKQNNISINQSPMFKNPDSSTYANSITNIQPVDPNEKVISDSNNQVKDILIRLYNGNPWLADEKVFLEGPKIGKKTYYLGEYAAIMSKKQKEISPSIKSRVDKNANWLGALNYIVDKYGDRLVSEDITLKSVNPKRFQRALSFSSADQADLSDGQRPFGLRPDDSMSGFGRAVGSGVRARGDGVTSTSSSVAGVNSLTARELALKPRALELRSKGRRSILKHEFDKLQGARGLGNDNRRLERELKLIRRAF
jgi:hypothetical protein